MLSPGSNQQEPQARKWLSCRRRDRLQKILPVGWQRGPEDGAQGNPEAMAHPSRNCPTGTLNRVLVHWMRELVLEPRDFRQRGLILLDLAGESVPLEVEQHESARLKAVAGLRLFAVEQIRRGGQKRRRLWRIAIMQGRTLWREVHNPVRRRAHPSRITQRWDGGRRAAPTPI
jgi:hypothetical protein